MRRLDLVPIGTLERELVEDLASGLAETFSVRCGPVPTPLAPEFAYHRERQQYHSSELLFRLQEFVTPQSWRILGVAAVDLYIPILTFVFGEAQMGGPCAIVSLHRLRQEFYGLPEDTLLLQSRLLKEAVHEIGHTLDLAHCDDYSCVMAPSHAVEWVDLKQSSMCPECQRRVSEGSSRAASKI